MFIDLQDWQHEGIRSCMSLFNLDLRRVPNGFIMARMDSSL